MSHTFDIRFARSAGLASYFEAPNNSFRWKGRGRLLVDPHGVSIAFERGLLGMRLRTRRLDVDSRTEVYREGAALRFEFANEGAKREVLPLWARDRAAAAEIVRLLSTRRTVEIEEPPAVRGDYRPDWRVVWAVVVLLCVAIAALMTLRSEEDAVPATASAISPRVLSRAASPASAPVLRPPSGAAPRSNPTASS